VRASGETDPETLDRAAHSAAINEGTLVNRIEFPVA
jgi:hypothetical protein